MIRIDPENRTLTTGEGAAARTIALDTAEAFNILSSIYVRSAWETKYLYTFSWFGRPIIQLPDDMFRVQEVLFAMRPDVVIETGVAHGGSLVFYASLFEAMGHGRVIGVDIEIRKHNREAIENHPLFHRIDLVEGDSTSAAALDRVRSLVPNGSTVIVFLDSNHSYDHVRKELELYAPFVSPKSWIVATDGIMKDLVGSPRSSPDWASNNPFEAARDFLQAHPEFMLREPARPFDESIGGLHNLTQWPGAWLERIR